MSITSIPSRTIVLISGFARAGKDTLAGGAVKGSAGLAVHINLADALKKVCNNFLHELNIGGDYKTEKNFMNEPFKCQNRNFLVDCGKFARSLDEDVFANAFLDECDICSSCHPRQNLVFVCSDWRYLNEFQVVNRFCQVAGWKLVTVYIETEGTVAPNEEEAKSIGQLKREVAFDHVRIFDPNSREKIEREGFYIAQHNRL